MQTFPARPYSVGRPSVGESPPEIPAEPDYFNEKRVVFNNFTEDGKLIPVFRNILVAQRKIHGCIEIERAS
jgi:hypothetical protein